MRPLKLIMTAFGPYPQEEIVDFTELNGKNLFLITGPTGAGKTTIFDGICFAMYGETSGNERNPESLRSDFAKDDMLTEVTLEFELKKEKYIIHRIPKQMRKKKRGEGFAEQKPEAYMTVDNGSDEKKVITGVSGVNNKVSEIMGINAEQFRQILMIPQGSFRKLLTANSEDREKVLQKIFNTKLYKDFQLKLKIKASGLHNEIKSGAALRESAVSRIDAFENIMLSEMVSNVGKNIPKIIEETKKGIKLDKEKNKELEEKEKSILGEVNKLTIEKTKSEENNKKLNKKEELLKEKTIMEAQKDEIAENEKELNLANKALTITPIEQNYNDRKDEKDNKEKQLKEIGEELQKSKASMDISQEKFKIQTSEENVKKRNLLNERVTILKGYIDKVKDFEIIKSEKFSAEKQCIKLNEEKQILDKIIGDTKKQIEDLSKDKDKAQIAAVEYEKLKSSLDRLKDILVNINNLSKAERNLDNKRKIYGKEDNNYKIIEKEFQEETKKYDTLNKRFIEGQSALIAKELKEGDACPVCGSVHHINLAKMGEEIPSEEELKAQGEKMQKVQNKLNDKKAEIASLRTEGKNAKENLYTRAEELLEKINESSEIIESKEYSLDFDKFKKMERVEISSFIAYLSEQVEEKVNSLNIELKEINKLRELYNNIEKKIIYANEILKKNEESIKENEKSLADSTNSFTQAKTRYNEIVKEIPEEVRELRKLLLKIKEVEELRNNLELQLESARKEYENASKILATNIASKEYIEKELEMAKLVLKRATETFKHSVEKAGFPSYKDYINSKRNESWMQSMKASIEKYRSALKSIGDRYADLEKSTEGISIVDISLIQSEIEEKNKVYKEINNEKGKAQNRIQNNRSIIKEIEDINKKIEIKENKHRLMGELSNVANGTNSAKITFERYVLAAFLDDILVAANMRLRKMTDGRFELSRTDELERKNKQSGLELEVFDAYTGRARHVKTLSGGEGFKASLSMALGLSDVVQSYAGGVRLDTMFIDEGFGTLDPESLDNAIECLIDLQKSGRLVGIISHVPELKERIDAKLEVIAGNGGSYTRFV